MNSWPHVVAGYLRTVRARQGEAEEDRELLRRFAQTGEDDAFAALMRRHGPMVLGLARRVAGDGQIAEDVLQATFLLLARKVHTIRRPESLSCWLHGVAYRLALQARRSQLQRRAKEAGARSASPSSPLDELTAREFLAVLDEELGKLPESYRAPLVLCCLEGLSQEEAAKRLGCSAGAIRGRLERGRNRLRQRLEKRGLMLPAVFGGTLLLADSARALPSALMQSTLNAVKSGAGATPAAALLVQEAMRSMIVHKLKALGAAVALLVLTGTGVGMLALPPQTAREDLAPAAARDDRPMSRAPRLDLYGDPLPEGALLRLGTLQRRAVGARLAVTADGNAIVSVRGGKYVCIWDAATGKLRKKHQLPVSSVSDSTLSADGRLLLTGIQAGTNRLKLWEVRTGKALQTLTFDGAGAVWPAVFSPDGKAVAAVCSAGEDHRIRIWELATGKVVFRKDVRGGVAIRRLLFTPDGKRLLAILGAAPPCLACWDLSSGRQHWNVNNFDPYAMVCTPDGRLLSLDPPRVLDLATGQAIESEKMPATQDNFVLRMLLSPDGRTLFVSTFQKVIVWDRVHGKVVRTLAGAGERIALWPDGKSVLTNNAGLQRWDVDSGKPMYADTFAHGHTGEVGRLVWSADGRRLASDATGIRVNTDGTLRVWDAVTGQPLHLQHERRAMRFVCANSATETGDAVIDLSPDGRCLLTNALGEPSLKMWEAETGKEVHTLEFPPAEREEVARQLFRARFSSDGARIVALLGGQSNFHIVGETPPPHKLVVWDAKTGKRLTTRPVGWTESVGCAIAPDGRTVVSSGVLIDVASGKEIARLEGTRQYARLNIAFARDGALLAGESPVVTEKDGALQISRDGVRVWETATGKTVAHVKMKPRSEQVFFHPDNRFVATNDVEGVRLWDVLTGKLAQRRAMPEIVPVQPARGGFASCPSFAPDGRLATGHPDGTILIWSLPLPARKTETLAVSECEALWVDLASADAARAWRVVWRLADAPGEVLPFLRGRIKPFPIAAAKVTDRLIADLDSDAFAARQDAAKHLRALGLQAEPALRAALKARPSLEMRRRIEGLLAELAQNPQPLAAEDLRQLRALIVLERIGTLEARRVVEEVARGPESARLTRQARAVLSCLP